VTSPLSDDPPQREDETPREDHAFLGCRAYDWCRICHYDSDGCGLMPSDPVHVPALLAERDSLSKRLERLQDRGWILECAKRIEAEGVWHTKKDPLDVQTIAAIIREYAETAARRALSPQEADSTETR
jgi:hypothetical protein